MSDDEEYGEVRRVKEAAPLPRDPARRRMEEHYVNMFSEVLYLYSMERGFDSMMRVERGWTVQCPVCGYSVDQTKSGSLRCDKVCRRLYEVPLKFSVEADRFTVRVTDLLELPVDSYFLDYGWNAVPGGRLTKDQLQAQLDDWLALHKQIEEMADDGKQNGTVTDGGGTRSAGSSAQRAENGPTTRGSRQ